MSELSASEQRAWDDFVHRYREDNEKDEISEKLSNYNNYYNNIRADVFMAVSQLLHEGNETEHTNLVAEYLNTRKNYYIDSFGEVTDWILSHSDHDLAIDTWIQFVQDDEKELQANIDLLCPAESFPPTDTAELRRQADAYIKGLLKMEEEFMNPDAHKQERTGIESGIATENDWLNFEATEDKYGEWVLNRHAAKLESIVISLLQYAPKEAQEAYDAAVDKDEQASDYEEVDPYYDPEVKAAEAHESADSYSPLLEHVSSFDQARDALLGVFHLSPHERAKIGDVDEYADVVVEQFDQLSRFVFRHFPRDEAMEFWKGLYVSDEIFRAEDSKAAKDQKTLQSVAQMYAEVLANGDDDPDINPHGLNSAKVMKNYRANVMRDIRQIQQRTANRSSSEMMTLRSGWNELLNDAQIALATLAANLLKEYIDKKQTK